MINIKCILLLSVAAFVACDAGEVPKEEGDHNLNADSSEGGLIKVGKKTYLRTPDVIVGITTYNGSEYSRHWAYTQGSVTLEFIGDALCINGKEVAGVKANEVIRVDWGPCIVSIRRPRNDRLQEKETNTSQSKPDSILQVSPKGTTMHGVVKN
ncbi:uncharacterized protein LOC126838954 isoform X2 [Adelges cooleyi]|uniref:uncharacterized protein LOC126838954 isoform X2 n=1 Tax=Adelges cooleyi TaxID=133065 RepID=UPI00217FA4A4|nr:uncharacterized protein LOC126838954 isoform X2 [Adelges cooleyi]